VNLVEFNEHAYALKKWNVSSADVADVKRTLTFLQQHTDPHLLRVFNFELPGEDGGLCCALIELVSAGDIRGTSMTFEEKAAAITSLIAALKYLHRNCMIHGRVTPGNLMVDGPSGVKLSAAGAVRFTGGTGSPSDVTVGYAAPETMSELVLTEKSDVFSAALVIAYIINGEAFIESDVPLIRACEILMGVERPPLPASVLPELARLLERMWATEAGDRPTSAEAWEELESMNFRCFTEASGVALKRLLERAEALPTPGGSQMIRELTRGRGCPQSGFAEDFGIPMRPGRLAEQRGDAEAAAWGEPPAQAIDVVDEAAVRALLNADNGDRLAYLATHGHQGSQAAQWLIDEAVNRVQVAVNYATLFLSYTQIHFHALMRQPGAVAQAYAVQLLSQVSWRYDVHCMGPVRAMVALEPAVMALAASGKNPQLAAKYQDAYSEAMPQILDGARRLANAAAEATASELRARCDGRHPIGRYPQLKKPHVVMDPAQARAAWHEARAEGERDRGRAEGDGQGEAEGEGEAEAEGEGGAGRGEEREEGEEGEDGEDPGDGAVSPAEWTRDHQDRGESEGEGQADGGRVPDAPPPVRGPEWERLQLFLPQDGQDDLEPRRVDDWVWEVENPGWLGAFGWAQPGWL
jgi:hypothetical protein